MRQQSVCQIGKQSSALALFGILNRLCASPCLIVVSFLFSVLRNPERIKTLPYHLHVYGNTLRKPSSPPFLSFSAIVRTRAGNLRQYKPGPAPSSATKQNACSSYHYETNVGTLLRLAPLRHQQNKTDKPILSKSCPLIPYYFLFVKLFLQQNNHQPKIIVPTAHSTPAPTPHSMLIFYPLPSPLWLKYRL